MKKQLRNVWIRLSLKYNVKKEYFTVALPVLLSVLFIIASIYNVGYLGPGKDAKKDEKTLSLDNFTEGQEITDEMIQKLVDEKAAKEKGIDVKRDKRVDSLAGIAVVAVLIAIIPYSIDLFLRKRRLRRYEDDFSDYLFQMSEMMRGGIDPVKATLELSKTDLGSITGHVRKATARMSFGKSFEYSMKKMAEEMKSRLIERYIDLLIHASYTGGNVSQQIMKSSEDMKKFISLEKEKEGSLKMYIIIMYMAQGLLLLIAGVFVFQVLPSLQNVNVGMFIPGATGRSLPKADIMMYITHIILINAVFVGLISGKVSSGSVKNGLKHSAVLLIGSYAVVLFVIMPQVVGVEELNIVAVSYPKATVMGGLPLPEPIVFKVTDSKGKPVANATIAFSIKPSTGKITKSGEKTSIDGTIPVYITPGVEPGTYSVQAKYNEDSGSAEIKVGVMEET
jgi:flagellar protein FlaJ